MQIKFGEVASQYGPGVAVELTGDELATAIDLYLYSQGVCVNGPRTTTVNGQMCQSARVYVDPSGDVMANGTRYNGNGRIDR